MRRELSGTVGRRRGDHARAESCGALRLGAPLTTPTAPPAAVVTVIAHVRAASRGELQSRECDRRGGGRDRAVVADPCYEGGGGSRTLLRRRWMVLGETPR